MTEHAKEVKRFDCSNGKTPFCMGCNQMEQHDEGDYVAFEDYEKLSAEIAELKAMLHKKLDLIKCGIATNYSGDPYDNPLWREAYDLLVRLDKPE